MLTSGGMVFEKIQHIGYLTPNLESAIAWFERSFGGVNGGGGPLPKGYAVPMLGSAKSRPKSLNPRTKKVSLRTS